MLRADYLNVGDGDAALIRLIDEGQTQYTLLIDTGRPDVRREAGSLRSAVWEQLSRERVTAIDCLLISHLHLDHFGAAEEVLKTVPVRRILTLYRPPMDAAAPHERQTGSKSTAGLLDALRRFLRLYRLAEEQGVEWMDAKPMLLPLKGDLSARLTLPDAALIDRQRDCFDRLYHGEEPTEETLYRVSKERNNSSLRVRLLYCGAELLFTGDAYAAYWENEQESPCTILKLPHHGDQKSMTGELIDKLNPAYSVVSCQQDPESKKERPCQALVSLYGERGLPLYCTENRALEGLAPATHEKISFTIDAVGRVTRLDTEKTEASCAAEKGRELCSKPSCSTWEAP